MVLGRFAPTDRDVKVSVHLEGRGPDGPVRLSTDVVVPAADGGNEFLPRLWARRHLDALLAQGASPENQAEIVEFSERFGILTPYTSLLVLESDEDREKYGVGRRVAMRDGERFFAEARDRAAAEARRAALRDAGAWRAWLRDSAMREIAGLGREFSVPAPILQTPTSPAAIGETVDLGMQEAGFGVYSLASAQGVYEESEVLGNMAFEGGEAGGFGGTRHLARGGGSAPAGARKSLLRDDDAPTVSAPAGAPPMGGAEESEFFDAWDARAGESANDGIEAEELAKESGFVSFPRRAERARHVAPPTAWTSLRHSPWWDGLGWPTGDAPFDPVAIGFPALPPDAPRARSEPPKTPWSAALRERLAHLLRRDRLLAATRAWHVVALARNLHPITGRVVGASRRTSWIAADGWRVDLEDATRGSDATAWTLGGRRVVIDPAARLGRRRPSGEDDATAWSLPIADLAAPDLLPSLEASYDVRIVEESAGRSVWRFVPREASPRSCTEWVFDESRRALVEERMIDLRRQRVLRRTVHRDFVTVGDLHLPVRSITFDARDRAVIERSFAFRALDIAAWDAVRASLEAPDAEVLVLDGALPKAADARAALERGDATLADRLTILADASARRDAEEVARSLESLRSADPTHAFAIDYLAQFAWMRTRSASAWDELLPRRIADVREGSGRRGVERAWRLFGATTSSLGPTSRVELLTSLRSMLASDAAPSGADDLLVPEELAWRRRRYDATLVQALDAAERSEEAFRLALDAAARMPDDLGFQLALAHRMRDRRDRAGSRDVYERAGSRASTWDEGERDALFSAWTDVLWQDRRTDDLARVVRAWTELNPESVEAWQRATSIDLLFGRDSSADAASLATIADGPSSSDDDVLRARRAAAITLLLGRGWQFYLSGPQPDHAEALAAFALRALDPTRDTDDESRGAGSRILGNHAFGGLEVGRRARLAAFGLLADHAATAPRERLEPLVALEQRYHDPRAEEVRRVLDILVARHRAESDPIERDALATWILDRFDRLDDRPGALGFLRDEAARRRVANEPIETVARHLVQRLLNGPDGDEAVETEIVEWVATLAGLQTDERRAAADAASWARRLAETFENWRTRLALGPPEALDALSREARAAAERAARQAARASLPARLDALHAMLPPSFAPWLRLEALAASVQSGAEIEARTAWALERLESAWARERRPSERVERERLSTAVAFATLRREPPQGLAERWIRTMDGLDAADRAAHATEVPPHWALDARYHVARFLAAHDRVAELRARLETWLGTEGTTSRWAVLLAHLEAEGGDLAAASARLEPLRARNELDAASLQRLATWRFALGDDAGRQAAFASALEQSDPWTLRQRLSTFAREVQRRGERAAAELDPDALPIAEQLLARDSSPEEYVSDLLALYLPTKDPRIPALFVPGLVGHGVERAYGALLALSGIVDGVHEEATLDALEAAIDARRRAAGMDRDRRVLDLATSRVASRTGEVLAADPALARAATTALERALAAPLGAGERLPLARHLAALAVSRDPSFDRIVTTGLASLVRDAAPGEERWRCAVLAAGRLERGGRLDERDDLLERTWKEVRSASPERLGRAEAELLEALVAAHRERRHVERAESFLLAELAERPHDPYTQTWSERLFELRRFALQSGLRTRLGEGAALHAALRAEVLAQLDELPERVSPNVANLVSVTNAAVKGTSRLKDAARDLAAWAHGPLHDLLARHPLEATHLATMVAEALVGLVGPSDGVKLLLDRVDAEPALVRRIGADVARQSLGRMASWRSQGGGAIRSLEPRLFSLVSAALESHLLAGTQPGRPFWTVHDQGVPWNERLDELQAVIEAVVERESAAAHVAMRGANVLYGPMQRRGAAIDVLEAAVARIPDEVSMRRHLVDWLIDAGRARRARPHAEKLVTDHPDEWSDRRRLARVLIQLRRSDDLAAHLDATEARWKERKAFRSSLARSLADFAREGDLAPRALAWIKEALSLRIAERGDRGGQDPWLSDTYGILAEIHRARRESGEAFAAARAALVHTSARDATRRNTAESRLADVLRDAPDLEPLDAAYEAEVAQEGLDAAPLRIAFAIAWQDRDRIDRAERHLLEAREIEPGVARVHTLLVSLYDRAGRPADAIGALFGSIENAPTALDAIEDLARRYATAGDEVERRRALTTLAEQAPHQADGHRRLGRAWSADGRHAEALEQWAQVVRTDPLDPNSWLEYADEAVRAGDLDTARRALDRVANGSWDDRFGDVKAAAAARRARLPRPPGPR